MYRLEPTEKELIRLCIQNDPKGQRILYNKYVAKVARTSLRYIKEVEESKEVTANVFIKIFKEIGRFDYRGEGGFLAWITKITVNECLMALRKKKKVFMSIDNPTLQLSEDLIPINFDVNEIVKLIQLLPEGYRTVFNLFVIEGYAHGEIAEKLQITESASRSQLAHARNKLKELLLLHRL